MHVQDNRQRRAQPGVCGGDHPNGVRDESGKDQDEEKHCLDNEDPSIERMRPWRPRQQVGLTFLKEVWTCNSRHGDTPSRVDVIAYCYTIDAKEGT